MTSPINRFARQPATSPVPEPNQESAELSAPSAQPGRQPKRGRSLAWTGAGAILAAMTVVLAMLGVMDYQREHLRRLHDLQQGLSGVARHLADIIALPLWDLDVPQVERLVESAMEGYLDVQAVLVSDPRRTGSLTGRGRDQEWGIMTIVAPPAEDGLLWATCDIVRQGEVIGSVSVWATDRFTRHAMRQFLVSRSLDILLANVVLGAALWIVFRRSVLRPLRQVERYAFEVSRGFDSVRLPERGFPKELKSLLTSIGGMVATLSDRYGELAASRAAVEKAEARYRDIFENAVMGIFENAFDGAFLLVNTAVAHMLGYETPDALIADVGNVKNVFVDPRDREGFLEHLLAHGAVSDFKARFRRRDATMIWLSVNARLIMDAAGDPVRVSGLVQDITARHLAETALRDSEEKYRIAIESANDAVFVHAITDSGLPGSFVEVNEEACRRLGYTREELLRLRPMDLDDARYSGNITDIMAVLRRDGFVVFETAHMTKGGRSIPVEVSTREANLRGGPFIISIARDITERKKAEKALQESESRFRGLFENAPMPYQSLDENGLCLDVNASWLETLGYEKEEVAGRWFGDFLGPDSVEAFSRYFSCFKQNLSIENAEFDLVKKNGETIRVVLSGRVQLDSQGRFLRTHYIFTDITARKLAEENLRKSRDNLAAKQEKLDLAMDLAGIAAWEYDVASDTYHFDDRFFALFATTGEREGGSAMAPEAYARAFLPPDEAPKVRLLLDQLLAQDSDPHQEYERTVLRRDGALRIMSVRCSVLRDESGRPAKIVGAVQDITERKHAENALRDSEEQLRSQLEFVLSPGVDLDSRALRGILETPAVQAVLEVFVTLTGAAVGLFDLKGKLLARAGWQDICSRFHRVHPESGKKCLESDTHLNEHLAQGEYVAYKCSNSMWDMVTPLHIGDRHVANIFTGQFFYDDEEIDPADFLAQAEMYGYDRDAYMAALASVPRFSREKVATIMDFLVKFADLVSSLGYSNLKLAKALSDQKRIQDRLRASRDELVTKQAMLVMAMTLTGMAVWEFDPRSGLFRFDDQFYALYGTSLEREGSEVMDFETYLREFVFPEDIPIILKQRDLARDLTPGTLLPGFEHRIVRRDGEIRHISVHRKVMFDNEGRLTSYFGANLDITERKLAEESIRRSERQYRTLVDNIPLSIIYKDRHSVFLSVNAHYAKPLGLTPEDFAGKTDFDFYDRALAEKYQADDKRIMDTGVPEEFDESYAIHGVEQVIHTLKTPVQDANGCIESILVIFWDVTEARRAEAAMRLADKMSAVGVLAGGVAHDFNNILGSIANLAMLAKRELPESSEARGDLEQILESAKVGKDIVHHLLAFRRSGKEVRKAFDPAMVAAKALRLMRSTFPAYIAVRTDLPEKDGMILADESQFHQVVLNLCANAVDAMRGHPGVLSVTIGRQTVETGHPAPHPSLAPGKYMLLRVGDTGPGIDPKIRERVFEPFFTTKPKGRGTGLGLAVVHGIVSRHNGAVTVQDAPGKGTIFTAYFPAIEMREGLAEVSAPPQAQGTGRILFVDDEMAYAQSAKRILEGFGHSVTLCSGGEEALGLLRHSPQDFDLLLTDLGMPGMDGGTLARQALALRPELPVVVCTGYGDAFPPEKARDIGVREYLIKPVDWDRLSAVIRSMLQNRE